MAQHYSAQLRSGAAYVLPEDSLLVSASPKGLYVEYRRRFFALKEPLMRRAPDVALPAMLNVAKGDTEDYSRLSLLHFCVRNRYV